MTVRMADVLVTEPAELETLQRNVAPLSHKVATGVVYDAEVAPLIFDPFFFH